MVSRHYTDISTVCKYSTFARDLRWRRRFPADVFWKFQPFAKLLVVKRKAIFFIFAFVALVIVAAAGLFLWMRTAMDSAHSHNKADVYITIERGTPPAAIISKLESERIIADARPVLLYLRLFGDGARLKAGDYRFDSPITPRQVLSELEKGETRTIKFTIPEGFTRFDLVKRIKERLAAEDRDEQEILRLFDDTSAIRDIAPQAPNLEGYIYPSTYELRPEARTEDVIRAAVSQFRKIWKPEWAENAARLGLTPHQVVTIASLVETETAVAEERPVIASVIYNRLKRGIPLGIDQTSVYVAKMEGRWDSNINKSDLEADSPYNTRKHAGLPPGPIASPSASSIEAALSPAETDFLFFVRDVAKNDGSHRFYASAADFERGKAEYQRWLRQQREK